MIGLEGETTGQWHLMIGLEGETTGQWHLMIGLEGETTGLASNDRTRKWNHWSMASNDRTGRWNDWSVASNDTCRTGRWNHCQWHLMIGLEGETTDPIGTKFGLFSFPIFWVWPDGVYFRKVLCTLN